MPKLKILTDKKTIEASVGEAIIDLAAKEEMSILFGCRDGACGACMIKVIENPQNLSPIEDHEKDFLETMAARDDERLACQCRILGDVIIEVAE